MHFEDVMFLNFLRNRLKPNAVLTLFKIPNAPKQISQKRKAPKERNSETYQVAKKAKTDVQVGITYTLNYGPGLNKKIFLSTKFK